MRSALGLGWAFVFDAPSCSLDNDGTMNRVFVERETQCFKGSCCPSFWEEDEVALRVKHVPGGLALSYIFLLTYCKATCSLLGESHAERNLHTLAIARVYSSGTLGLVLPERKSRLGEHFRHRDFVVLIPVWRIQPGEIRGELRWPPGTARMPSHSWEAWAALKIRQHCAEPCLGFATAFLLYF